MFNCPHTGVALAALPQARRAQGHPLARARRRDLDRARAQVRRPEDRLSPRHSSPGVQLDAMRTGPSSSPPTPGRSRRDRPHVDRALRRTRWPSVAGVAAERPRRRPRQGARGGLRAPRAVHARRAAHASCGNAAHHADHPDGDLHVRRHRRARATTSSAASSARSTAATAIRRSASRSASSPRSRAPRTACCSRAAWRRSRPRCSRCCRRARTWSSPTTAYRRTRQFLHQVLHRYGVEVSTVPAGDYERLEDAVRPTTRLLLQRVADQSLQPHPRSRALRRDRPPPPGEDRSSTSTFATPINQRPLEFGIDLVIHSATKYLGGHNDLLAGAVLGSAASWSTAIRDLQGVTGAVVDPFAAYLLIRGIKTLALRIDAPERERAGARRVPRRRIPKVERVHYPGLASHPEHAIAARQMQRLRRRRLVRGRGDLAAASRLVDACRIPRIAPVARRRREPDRAAGADELLRAHAPRSGCRSGSRTT